MRRVPAFCYAYGDWNNIAKFDDLIIFLLGRMQAILLLATLKSRGVRLWRTP